MPLGLRIAFAKPQNVRRDVITGEACSTASLYQNSFWTSKKGPPAMQKIDKPPSGFGPIVLQKSPTEVRCAGRT